MYAWYVWLYIYKNEIIYQSSRKYWADLLNWPLSVFVKNPDRSFLEETTLRILGLAIFNAFPSRNLRSGFLTKTDNGPFSNQSSIYENPVIYSYILCMYRAKLWFIISRDEIKGEYCFFFVLVFICINNILCEWIHRFFFV